MLVSLWLKGGWENDETVEEAAAREALEEAGVQGDLLVRKSELILPFDCSRDRTLIYEWLMLCALALMCWSLGPRADEKHVQCIRMN